MTNPGELPGRPVPQAGDAERSLLGAVLLDPTTLPELSSIVGPTDFYRPAHRYIFASMQKLAAAGTPVDRVTVKAALEAMGVFEAAGGDDFLDLLDKVVPASANAPYYARIVLEKSRQREGLEKTERLLAAQRAEAAERTPENTAAVQWAWEQLDRESPVARSEEPPRFSVERLWEESKKTPNGRLSGWAPLDALDVRFNPGEVALVAARTGHAKTTVLVGLLWNWLRDSSPEETFLFYSHEEQEIRIFHRLLSLASVKLQSGALKSLGWTRTEIRDYARDPASRETWVGTPAALQKAQDDLRQLENRLLVVHRSGWTADQIAAHALRLARSGRRIGGVFGDYLQRIPAAAKAERRDLDVSAMSRRFKTLSEDLAAPVVLGAQLNRESVPKDFTAKLSEADSYRSATGIIRTARPGLHHLREGGSEQEADLVLGLLNYAADYASDSKTKTVPDVTLLEVGTLKNREGEQGRWAGLAFEGRLGLVRDMTESEEIDLQPESPPTRRRRAAPGDGGASKAAPNSAKPGSLLGGKNGDF